MSVEYLGQQGFFSSYGGTNIMAAVTVPGERPYVFAELQTISYSIHREKRPVRVLGTADPVGFTYGPRTIAGSLIFASLKEHVVRRAMKSIAEKTGRFVADQLPPFHVAISMADEYGNRSRATIYNCTIVDEGQVYSVEDLITETNMSYFASSIDLIRISTSEGHGQGIRLADQGEAPAGPQPNLLKLQGILVGPDVEGVRVVASAGDVHAETYSGPDGYFALSLPDWAREASISGYRNGHFQSFGLFQTGASPELTWDEPERTQGLSGRLIAPDRTPVDGAVVIARLANGRVLVAESLADGTFALPAPTAPVLSLVTEVGGVKHDLGVPEGFSDEADLGDLTVQL